MALSQSNQPVPLFGGLDTKTTPKYVAASQQLTLQNVRQFNPQSIKKRWGQTALSKTIGSTTATITAGKALGTRNNELLLFDGHSLYSRAQTQNTWLNKGTLTETLVNVQPVIQSSGSVSDVASIKTALAEVYGWVDSRGGVWAAARDPNSGTFILNPFQVNPLGQTPRIIASGGFIYLFYVTSNGLFAAQFNANSLSSGVLQTFTVATGSSTTLVNYFVTAAGSVILVGAPYNPDFSGMIIAYNSQFQTLATNSTTYTASNTNNVRPTSFIGADGNFYWLVVENYPFVSGQAIAVWGSLVGSTLSISGSDIFVLSNITAISDTAVTALPGASGGNGFLSFIVQGRTVEPSGSSVTGVASSYEAFNFAANTNPQFGIGAFRYGLQIAASPAILNGTPYFVAISPSTTISGATSQNCSYYLCSAATATKTTIQILQRFSGSIAFGSGVKPSITLLSGALFVGLTQRTALREDQSGTIYAQTGLATVNFTFPTVSGTQVVQFNQETLINCGATYSYDGTSIVESGFWSFPEGIQTGDTPATNSGLSTGLYLYSVTYEWPDAAGNVMLSAPSYPSPQNADGTFGITVAAGDQINLTVPYLNTTLKTGVQVCIYRTTANQSGPYYKIATIDNTPGLSGLASFVYADRASDVSIQSQQFLYAPPDGSGEIENDAPPPFLYMVATKTRAFGIAQDDRTALWYSKPLTTGRPAEWSQAQIIRIETDGGDVTGLSYLNTQAVIFKANRILYLPGNGPNSSGQPANGFPQTLSTVSTTSGCVNNKSILPNSTGLYYQSALGLESLNLSLTNDPTFGLPVQKYAQLPFIGTATVVGQNQLRWVTSTDTALIYDYIVKGWNTYTNYSSVAYTLWENVPVRLASNGQCYIEDQTTYLDAGQPVQMAIETAWLKPAQMAQGFAAVWYAMIMGRYLDPHKLTIEVAYDYLDATQHYYIFNATTNGNFGTYGSGSPYGSDPVYGANTSVVYTHAYQPRISLQRQVCEAIKFKIYDSSITGASCELNEIALQLGVIGGLNRVPVRQQI